MRVTYEEEYLRQLYEDGKSADSGEMIKDEIELLNLTPRLWNASTVSAMWLLFSKI